MINFSYGIENHSDSVIGEAFRAVVSNTRKYCKSSKNCPEIKKKKKNKLSP